MKRVILSLLAATAMTAAASAADLPMRHKAPATYIPPVFTWTGFYAGLNAGYAWNGGDKLKDVSFVGWQDLYAPTYENGLFNTRHSKDQGSFTGGIQFGYNYQIGSFVVGAETDFNYVGTQKDYYAGYIGPVSGVLGDDIYSKSKTQWYGTVRTRLGFTPVDRLMLYVSGGFAYGQVKSSAIYNDYAYVLPGYSLGASTSGIRYGWTLGAGAEYAITDHITLRGEYAYVDLGSDTHRSWSPVTGNSIAWKDSATFHVVRAAVNYKF